MVRKMFECPNSTCAIGNTKGLTFAFTRRQAEHTRVLRQDLVPQTFLACKVKKNEVSEVGALLPGLSMGQMGCLLPHTGRG